MSKDWCSHPHVALGCLLEVSFLARRDKQSHASQKHSLPEDLFLGLLSLLFSSTHKKHQMFNFFTSDKD